VKPSRPVASAKKVDDDVLGDGQVVIETRILSRRLRAGSKCLFADVVNWNMSRSHHDLLVKKSRVGDVCIMEGRFGVARYTLRPILFAIRELAL